jgi:periplasmic protein TonB
MQDTSLLELFETALGRPRPQQAELPIADRAFEVERCPIAVAEPEPLEPSPPPPELTAFLPRRLRLVTPSLLVSIALHATPVAGLLAWSSGGPEIPQPVPVQLVVVQPPPLPPPPKEEKAPPRGPLASEDTGKMAAPPDTVIAKPTPPPPPPAEPVAAPKEMKLAEIPPPPPKPKPKPKPQVQPAVLRETPRPAPPLPPEPRPPARAPQPEPVLTNAPKNARYPGPAATRDDYLAYLVTLTRQHIDLLPRAFLADRRGETVLTILVLGDGTIARISVRESSGYPDIDQRIEQMVQAVGRFPPLPQWYQQPAMDLTLRLRFPEAITE